MIDWLDDPKIEKVQDPPIRHCSSRDGFGVNAVFIHYTAGGHYKNSTLNWWRDPNAKASAHGIIGRGENEMLQCVPFSVRAWHAGLSALEAYPYSTQPPKLADFSAVGLEVANFGKLVKKENLFFYEEGKDLKPYRLDRYAQPVYAELVYKVAGFSASSVGWWEPYAPHVVANTAYFTAKVVEAFDIPLCRVLGHEDVATPPLRKTDPGPLWPWKSFIEQVAANLKCQVPNDVWKLHRTVS